MIIIKIIITAVKQNCHWEK